MPNVVPVLGEQLEHLWVSELAPNLLARYSYYSGSQIAVFIGDIFIDEAVFIAYDLAQAKRPVYGYASAYWDALLDGVVIVQGRLAINYIDNRYLSMTIFDHLRRRKANPDMTGMQLDNPIQQMEMLASLGAHNLLHQTGRANFQQVAETLKRKYWQEDFKLTGTPRPDQFPGVDIYISYGLRGNNATIKKIEQVSFMGETQVIEINGQPVLEIYNFIGRRIVNVMPDVVPNTN